MLVSWRRLGWPVVTLAVGAVSLIAWDASDVAARPAAAPAAPTPVAVNTSISSLHDITVGGRVRHWTQLTAGGRGGASAPILVVLHGRGATPEAELARDGFAPLARRGAAELVYPEGVGASWNAVGCCGTAARLGIDDTGFLRSLVARIDPGHARKVFLVGYSNGGRMAYTVACSAPALVDGFAVVSATPVSACVAPEAITILQVDGTLDPGVPYAGTAPPGETTATSQVAALRALDGCTGAGRTTTTGLLSLTEWQACGKRARVGFATYHGGTHAWPAGDATTPGAATVILDFLTRAAGS